jgi:hypothetical protein
VDESDIVKTDGSYLYVVKDSSVEILSAKEGELAHVCELTLTSSEADSAVERVQELYVEGDRLIAILECTQNTLTDPTGEEIETPVGNGILPLEQEDTESASTDMAIADVAYYAVKAFTTTELQTYDISDRAHPVKVGTVTQDGNYRESRKIGDVIYLFTMEGLTSPNLTREEALDEEGAGKWIPLINGEPVAACDIYLSERGSVGLAISSVDVAHPDDVVDETMIVYNGASLYISQSALYLYGIDYTQEEVITSIAKFSLTDGMIDAVGAAVVPGEVTDTFAISEQQGNLCVLTSDWSSAEIENGLYVLDEALSRIGTLEHLAEGETIYAVRYIGNMAYFVTYRNTDPLFAVDLSDPTKPTVKSELTISGFSEYLHDWGTDDATGRSLLLGIGYETDAQTGLYRGIKLTMFDVTDPSEPQIADTYIIKTANYSPALYFYKSVLAEPGEDLIGLVVTMQNAESFYQFYAWEDGAFVQKSSNSLGVTEGSEEFRGLYIGDYAYVASSSGVTSYDRNDSYREVDKLEL